MHRIPGKAGMAHSGAFASLPRAAEDSFARVSNREYNDGGRYKMQYIFSLMPRPRTKTETLTFRVDPAVKRALAEAAASERRSMANMLELIILEWCEQHPSREADVRLRRKDNHQ